MVGIGTAVYVAGISNAFGSTSTHFIEVTSAWLLVIRV
jgi:hypothetical protein